MGWRTRAAAVTIGAALGSAALDAAPGSYIRLKPLSTRSALDYAAEIVLSPRAAAENRLVHAYPLHELPGEVVASLSAGSRDWGVISTETYERASRQQITVPVECGPLALADSRAPKYLLTAVTLKAPSTPFMTKDRTLCG